MSEKKNIVDISPQTKKDIYYVAKTMSDEHGIIFRTNKLEKAIERAKQEKETYYVYNSKGKIIYAKKKTEFPINVNANQKIKADGINVYSVCNNTIPDSCYHGTLTILDDRLYSNKYKVQTDEEFPITYFCNCDDIKKYIRNSIE